MAFWNKKENVGIPDNSPKLPTHTELYEQALANFPILVHNEPITTQEVLILLDYLKSFENIAGCDERAGYKTGMLRYLRNRLTRTVHLFSTAEFKVVPKKAEEAS